MAVRENTEQYTVVMILLGAVSLDSSEAIIMTTLREIESNYDDLLFIGVHGYCQGFDGIQIYSISFVSFNLSFIY